MTRPHRDTCYTFDFGQPVKKVIQEDRTPKRGFVLRVYSSAVHATWIGPDGSQKIAALAVASEPYIFWRGEGAAQILAGIIVPPELGRLNPAPPKLNGPSGRSLDEHFLRPLGFTRDDSWFCDIVPHSCLNPKQDAALKKKYFPVMNKHGLSHVSLPPVPKTLCGAQRRAEIAAELAESQARTIILLGDEPIRWFLHSHEKRWKKLSDFGVTPETYGREHDVTISGRKYQALPLVHPRQAAKLGRY